MFTIDISYVLTFVLAGLQVSAILLVLPLFGEANVPMHVRIFFAFSLTLAVFNEIQPALEPWVILQLKSPEHMILAMLKAVLLGVTIGFGARLIVLGLSAGANIVGMQMGFGFS